MNYNQHQIHKKIVTSVSIFNLGNLEIETFL